MNNVLSLLQTARSLPEPQSALYSDHMLAELLSLHGDMIKQLRLEQMCSPAKAEFLTRLIQQHENTAAMLRSKLENGNLQGNEAATQNSPARSTQRQTHYRCLSFAVVALATLQSGSPVPPTANTFAHSCIQKSNPAPA